MTKYLSTRKTRKSQKTIIHCLGSLFKLTESGLSHVVGKIDDNTYFADPKFFQKLNELAFVDQVEIATPEAVPQKEGLLALAYRFMTAPFTIRTPKNMTTRARQRKSNPIRLVSPAEITGTNAETKSDSMKLLPPNEMFLLNTTCEKSITDEVQFYFKDYQDFITSDNQKLIAVLSALNAANMGRYNDLIIRYPGFLRELPVININKLNSVVQSIFLAQVLKYTIGDKIKNPAPASPETKNEKMKGVGLFPPKCKNLDRPANPNLIPINTNEFSECLGKPQMEQSVEEVNEDLNERGSYQPPDNPNYNSRGRPRSPVSIERRDRYRYDVTDRRYRFDYNDNRSDSSENYQLTASQLLEAKLFLDKILYFNGPNNNEALNFLAQCEEAAEKMKASETTVVWSKLAGRDDVVMREESRQHEGTVTWEIFQSMLTEHFYHIPSKERAAKLLNKLQQDPHESIGEYVQRGSEIIQVHLGKTSLKEISASQYRWNIVQGLNNVSIKNKIAD